MLYEQDPLQEQYRHLVDMLFAWRRSRLDSGRLRPGTSRIENETPYQLYKEIEYGRTGEGSQHPPG
jgi:hypothetical protein